MLQAPWQVFDAMAHSHPIHSEADFERMPSLLELASDLVYPYDQEHHGIQATEPKDELIFLMESSGLKKNACRSWCLKADCRPSWLANARLAPSWRVGWGGSLTSVQRS